MSTVPIPASHESGKSGWLGAVALGLVAVGSLGVAGYALVAYTLYTPGSTVHPQMKAVYAQMPFPILLHVFASLTALALGPWQFIAGLRKRFPRAHRWTGRAYLGLGVLPGGLAGLYMSFHSAGGWPAHAGFALGAVIWLVTAYFAYATARRRDFAAHRRWMIINFAMTFAAVTLRIQLGSGFAAGLPFEVMYPIVAWASWVPNLLFAVWWGRRGTGGRTSIR
jgi:uncharacterized membrane protein